MEQRKKTNTCMTLFLIILGLGLVIICLISLYFIFSYAKSQFSNSSVTSIPLPTPYVSKEQDHSKEVRVNADPGLIKDGLATLDILKNTAIPINDPIETAKRFEGIKEASVLKSGVPQAYKVGISKQFWKLDVDSNKYIQTEATLRYITPHLYFWVEEGIEYSSKDLAALAETFESKIYPTDREIFGHEWSPGVDNDIHLTILFAQDLGGVGGYFSSTDSSTREIEPYSNEMEMFYLSADYTRLDDPFTYGVLAHELQHMIHWNLDRNESAWITEGLSELAVELNGYDTGGFSYMFAFNPDLQLNFWPGNDQGDSTPHYGAAYLFMRYLHQRFGKSSIQDLVATPLNGFESIDSLMENYEKRDNTLLTSEQIFQDWSIANYLNGSSTGMDNDAYGSLPFFPSFSPTETLTCEDADWQERTVSQFGTDYIQVECSEPFQISIIGEPTINLLPVYPHSGESYFWSNYGDESNMRLTQTFDFTNATAPITLDFWTWYDIEKDYDYLYLTATEDGKNWSILKTSTCTEEDPTGANYGCGFNGKSGEWIKETVDLSAFAGKQVTLRFVYITDMAVNGDGFVIDDVSIDAVDYFSDFENDQGGWFAEGFVRIKNILPQSFGVTILKNVADNQDEKFISTEGLEYQADMDIDQTMNKSVVVISGLTRYTYQPALYQIRITKKN